ncbi:MAG: DUF4129 domain-containing protein [Mucilaginibacter sp.]
MKLINKAIRCLSILPALVFIPLLLFAGNNIKKLPVKVKQPLVLQKDTAGVVIQKFEAKKLRDITRDKDFDYDNQNEPGQSLWAQIRHWLWVHFFSHMFESSDSNKFFYYLFISLGVIFAVFVIFKAIGIDAMQIIRGSAKTISVPYTESLENIHEVDFDAELDKAIASANYRFAVRLLYLSSLKFLNDKSLINWQIEKTNTEYINEIPEGSKRQTFYSLTRQFEYVWYGNFFIDANTFQSIRASFQQFKHLL